LNGLRKKIFTFALQFFFMTTNIFNSIFLGMIGTPEIIVILLVVLLLFGGKKIPELMRGLGRGMREFQDAKNNVKSEIHESISENKSAPKEK